MYHAIVVFGSRLFISLIFTSCVDNSLNAQLVLIKKLYWFCVFGLVCIVPFNCKKIGILSMAFLHYENVKKKKTTIFHLICISLYYCKKKKKTYKKYSLLQVVHISTGTVNLICLKENNYIIAEVMRFHIESCYFQQSIN